MTIEKLISWNLKIKINTVEQKYLKINKGNDFTYHLDADDVSGDGSIATRFELDKKFNRMTAMEH